MLQPVPVCIFVKDFLADQVKTRLIPSLGSKGAAELAKAMFQDTRSLVRTLPWAQEIVASTALLPDPLVEGCSEFWLQGDGDLGARLERILRRALLQSDAAMAIGSDSPGLPPELFEQARAQLQSSDAVLGPCDDGGFYLVGLRGCPPGLFAGIGWSRQDTLSQTVERFHKLGLKTSLLEPWFDIDRPEDLKKLRNLIDSGEIRAPYTANVLERLPVKCEIVGEMCPSQ